MSRYTQAWPYRKVVMEAIMDVLRDGKPRKAREILGRLPHLEGIKVDKKLVNSILSSEAKRYIERDYKLHTYRLRPADKISNYPPWDIVRQLIQFALRSRGPLTASELKDELEADGMYAPIWMLKSILSEDSFLHSTKSIPRQNENWNSRRLGASPLRFSIDASTPTNGVVPQTS